MRPAVNPATGAAFGDVSLLDAQQVGDALDRARAAFPAWSALAVHERSRLLLALRAAVLAEADVIAALVAQEQGKPLAEVHSVELFPSLDGLKHLARHAPDLLREESVEPQVLLFAQKECSLRYEPFGVVLVITPWNYPFSIALLGVATALAAGNTVVLKPAPATTVIGLKIGALCRQAGFPDGVVNVVAVDDALAPGLVEDPRVNKIVFTGSVATGKRVMAAAAKSVTPVVLELGGKDAAVVCRDADLDRAAAGLVWGAFMNCGQTCASVERVYVEEPVADSFIAKVVAETRKLRVGDPGVSDVELGPLTMERQRQIVAEHVDEAVARGAQALTGGARPAGPGFFYPPTVLVGVDHSMRVMREETFGPVLPIMRVASLDEAIRLANDSDFGLTASGWTSDPRTARLLQERLQAGVVTINDCITSFAEPSAPWGGFKQSGLGRTHGLVGLREMAQLKYVSRDRARGTMLWWFPYGAAFERLMTTANRAVHGGPFWRRIPDLLRLQLMPRFLKRMRFSDVLRGIDRLF
jgi:succinate-semialdehyde dehydrogenase/glutarate-semialdehyde dehydrogenase